MQSHHIIETIMKLTITKKIALSVIGIVMICIVTMAWLTSQNLQRGFMQYLNEVQAQQLEQLSATLADYYRRSGSFEMLRQNPRALNDLFERRAADVPMSQTPDFDGPQPPPPRPGEDRDGLVPPRAAPPAPPGRAAIQHPLILGPRLSLLDATGDPIIGPRGAVRDITSKIIVDGQLVGTLSLSPMQKIADANEASFVRSQIHSIQWLAAGLIIVAAFLALWLARHLLRPVAALRKVTQSISRGDLKARAPIVNQDELGELARHVNAMAQSLETNDQQRRKVLADVSHELRTPLTVMRGEIEAILDGIRQVDTAAVESLHAEVLHLGKLIDDLYQLALADAGDLHYRLQEINLNLLLQDVVGRFQIKATAANCALSLHLPDVDLTMQADSDRLVQVITNLLENSVRYTDAPGKINVSLACYAGVAELSIEDSPPGVPAGMHERLFERLYRVDQARSRQQGGGGLGLSICKVLIAAHGGTIHALPSTLGGVKVVIHLPVNAARKS
jgi:two-component system sensor histidine kinase BaeS